MSDMTDAETKAYFDGREEGFNDAREQIKELRTRVAAQEKRTWNEAINEVSWWLAKKESFEGTLYSEQIKELMR